MIREEELLPINMGKRFTFKSGDYYCNLKGEVFSKKRGTLKKLKPGFKFIRGAKRKYYSYKLYDTFGIHRIFTGHRIVAESFIRRFYPYITDEEISMMDVDHMDFNPSNNNISNLRFLKKEDHRKIKRNDLKFVNKNKVDIIMKKYFIDKIPSSEIRKLYNIGWSRLKKWFSSNYAKDWCKRNNVPYFTRERNIIVLDENSNYKGNITYDSWDESLIEKIHELYFKKGLNVLKVSKIVHKVYNGVSYHLKTIKAKEYCYNNNLEYYERYGNKERRYTREELKKEIERSK